jgi:amino acid adenylation domain-containing protein
MSFGELNSRANQLARHLRKNGVRPDSLVGLCADRSTDMVLGVLGILKAGGAYVPLDPDYPETRLQDILADASPRMLLTQLQLKEKLRRSAIEAFSLDADWHLIESYGDGDLDAQQVGLAPGHLAYVIYTSGTTGRPKGVMVERQNVLSLWYGLEEIYKQVPQCRRVAINASFNFDASVKQIVQLLSGCTVVIVPRECRCDGAEVLRFISEYQVDCIDCTPSQLKLWVSAGLLDGSPEFRPKLVLVGGEPITIDLWNRLAECKEANFWNVYGPTESTVDATATALTMGSDGPHIGKPMLNRRIYILDDNLAQAGIGTSSEIFIGGAGVARGYLNRPELTAERFMPDPFRDSAGSRMYRTGDVGSWRAAGTIDFLGRKDRQIKLRGHRIEIGEIETQISLYPGVASACVVLRTDIPGDPRLIAYVTATVPSRLEPEKLRVALRAILPEYMIPSAFVTLSALPLNSNGKLDRGALPLPVPEPDGDMYEPPEGELEGALAEIWCDVFRLRRVGRRDNFFELGGHSLTATRVVTRVGHLLDLEVPLQVIFEMQTVEKLGRWISQARAAGILTEERS